ncbi:MAG: 2OG-Fe(II) oxygenase [Xanthomonadales bacterium]|nr:2OG-Fe(II) oxygenase [Xanthomonadales bacterium]
MSCIDPRALSHAGEFQHLFATATPFRHVSIRNFLRRDLCERLLADFPRFEAQHALNEMGEVGGKAVRMDVREMSPAYRDLDAFLQTTEFLQFVSRVTGIPDLLYDPDYVGGGTHENRDGQALDAHVDFNYHPRTRWHRRLNLIVYLNPEWQDDWGGALELHSDPWNPVRNTVVRIPPLFNTCAIFETTESSWHGFRTICLPAEQADLSRKSFAIYLYTRARPPAESAPPHATIYVPDAMPGHLQAGHVLDAGDCRDLQQRFTRMRSQLRFLYEREKHFGAQIHGLESALGDARDSQRLPLQGYATQSHAPEGIWPDGWVGEELRCRFTPTRKMRRLHLQLWSPHQLGTDHTLQIELGDHRWTQVLRAGARTPVELKVAAPAGSEIALSVRAARTWIPSADGSSKDERRLAFRLLEMALEH